MMIQVTSNSLLSKESKRQLCSFSSQIYLIFFCYLINRLCANFQTLNSSYFIFRAVFKSVRGRRGCEYLFSKLFLTLRKNSIMLGLNFILLYNIETAKSYCTATDLNYCLEQIRLNGGLNAVVIDMHCDYFQHIFWRSCRVNCIFRIFVFEYFLIHLVYYLKLERRYQDSASPDNIP